MRAMRTRSHLQAQLRDQYEALTELGRLFDQGRSWAAANLAVVIRVLVHDTDNSHSLLGQMALKEELQFVDTALHRDPRNLLPTHPGLVVHQMTSGVGAQWVAPLSDLSPPRMHPPLPFDQWWPMPVTEDANGSAWSRKQLVLDVANTEGGAHVDPNRLEDLRQVEEQNTMGWTFSDPLVGADQPYENGPSLPSIRQIAYELQMTVESALNS